MQYWRLTNTTDPNILTLTSENTNAFDLPLTGRPTQPQAGHGIQAALI